MIDQSTCFANLSEDSSLSLLFDSYRGLGAQGSQIWKAAQLLKKLQELRSHEDPNLRPIVYLGFTSNMISSGLRDVIRFMAEHKIIDVIVTAGGGVEEDFMKCFQDSYIIDYIVNDREMRLKGENRIGNMMVPNNNYVEMEKWMDPILDLAYKQQLETSLIATPSSLVSLMGSRINDPSSVYHHCYKNDIPVFCPGLTDGAVGDNIFFNKFSSDEFVIDIMEDMVKIVEKAESVRPTAAIILGGGMAKYHVINACRAANNPLRFVANFNWGYEGECSYSGSKITQDISNEGVHSNAEVIEVGGDASLTFLLAACMAYGRF